MKSLLLIVSLFVGLPLAGAETIIVPDDYELIQLAVSLSKDGDEILVRPGEYNQIVNFVGKAITLRSLGGPEVTTIDATGFEHAVIQFENGEGLDSILDGFTLSGGTGESDLHPGLPVGGGIYINSSSPTIRNCFIKDNQAQSGGGVYNFGGAPLISNSRFESNYAWGFDGFMTGGGAIKDDVGQLTVENSIFVDNEADWDGGAFVSLGSDSTLINCLFRDNLATIGGGVGVETGSITLLNNTFSRNSGALGEAVRVGHQGHLAATNNIFWQNAGSVPPTEVRLTSTASAALNQNVIEGGWSGSGAGNLDLDPLFVNPDTNDFHLNADSPAIDAGDSSALPADIKTDLDGKVRVSGVEVDIGAYEVQTDLSACLADIDSSGDVGFTDLLAILNAWGPCEGCVEDLDQSGEVGLTDLLQALATWGVC